jgi:molybdate transport system regulatory protein
LYTIKYNDRSRKGVEALKQAWSGRPRWRLSRGNRIALGPGKADLLEAIRGIGTISGAARHLGMSYRRAWLLVETMNSSFVRPLVKTSSWRKKGAVLTRDGERVLALYRRLEEISLRSARRPLAELTALLCKDKKASIRRAR